LSLKIGIRGETVSEQAGRCPERYDLPIMAKYLYDNGVRKMVEVGCAFGISTRIWRDAGITVYGVDPYIAGYDSGDGQSASGRCEDAKKQFKQNIVDKKTIFHIEKKSIDAAKDFEDQSLDFVYIDACHKYESIKEDIYAWFPKIKTNMFIGGDDWGRIDYNTKRLEVNEAFIDILGQPDKEFNKGHILYKMEGRKINEQ